MTQRAPNPTPRRSLRKQDLLLASALARGQVVSSFDQLGERADGVADRIALFRNWLASPLALAAGSAAAAVVLGVALRRVPAAQVVRWGWLAWRLWRGLAAAPTRPVTAARRATQPPGGGAAAPGPGDRAHH
jgi:hypothetical protein